jgi:DNA-binding protein H-NS
MTQQTYASQQAKIQKEIERLNKQAQLLQSKQRKPVIASILRSMKEYGITPEEISAALGNSGTKIRQPSTNKAPKVPKASATKKPVAPKYRHPDTAATWTGRGKAPLWIVEAEKNGQPRQQFLI